LFYLYFRVMPARECQMPWCDAGPPAPKLKKLQTD